MKPGWIVCWSITRLSLFEVIEHKAEAKEVSFSLCLSLMLHDFPSLLRAVVGGFFSQSNTMGVTFYKTGVANGDKFGLGLHVDTMLKNELNLPGLIGVILSFAISVAATVCMVI